MSAPLKFELDRRQGVINIGYGAGSSPSFTNLTVTNTLTVGGSVHGANGSAANPSFAFNSDQDTGLYRIGANNLGVTVGGVKALDISSTGVTATTTLADQGGTIAAQRNGLAPRQGLAFDGTGSTTVTLPALGTNGLSASFWVTPTAIGSSQAILQGGANSLGVLITSAGNILATVPAVADRLTSTGTLTNGKTDHVAVTRTSAGVWVIYINGIASGTATTAVDDITATSYRIGSTSVPANYFIGAVSGGFIYNRALSAAEVLTLYQSGAVASADYNNAGTTDIKPSAGTYAYWFGTGSISAATASSFTIAAGASNLGVRSVSGAFSAITGRRYRATIVASGLTSACEIGSQGFTSNLAAGNISNGTNVIEFTATSTASGYFSITSISSTAGGTISISSMNALGALLAPDSAQVGAGLEWLDVSGNRAHIVLPTSGVSWSLPSSQQIVIEASTATNGNQQLGGASLIDANKQWRIQSWTVNCSTGTPTISLGNVSAGTQYNAAAVLAAGNNDITLVTRFPSTANLWVNSSTTATLIHRITLVPAN